MSRPAEGADGRTAICRGILFFNEIHKFDFYSFRGLGRDALVWFLMLMGTGISLTGLVVGWKHLTRPKPAKGRRAAA